MLSDHGGREDAGLRASFQSESLALNLKGVAQPPQIPLGSAATAAKARWIVPEEGGLRGRVSKANVRSCPRHSDRCRHVEACRLLLLQSATPSSTVSLQLALSIAWTLSGSILLSSTFLYRVLRGRGLMAMERLMGTSDICRTTALIDVKNPRSGRVKAWRY